MPRMGRAAVSSHPLLSGVTADQHHTQAHSISGADHSGSLTHAATSGQTANDHHAQAHSISGADHSGTLGHAALSGVTADQHHTQAHSISGADHSGTLTHAALSTVTADQHHTQAHAAVGADHTGVGVELIAVKTADETVNNSAVLQNDDHLVLTVLANTRYEIRFILRLTQTGGGLKWTIVGPAGWSGWMRGYVHGGAAGTVTTAASVNRVYADDATVTLSDATNAFNQADVLIELVYEVVIAGTAGTLQFQWAQSTATVANSTVKAGSTMIAKRVA